MSRPIEDYALIGDTQTAALVARDGSIDWLCLPRFDSPACFAALLGTDDNGHWKVGPVDDFREVSRRYRGETLILETTFTTADGAVRVVDFMPPRGREPDVVRLVEGVSGRVRMRSELVLRYDYGLVVPWVRRGDGAFHAVAGPDAVELRTPVPTRGEDLRTIAEFDVAAGETVPFVLTWHPSYEPPSSPIEPQRALRDTEAFWAEWAAQCTYDGRWRDACVRSMITLKALTFAPAGGVLAAATTSLPEQLGGVRNWDYRYCWLRDATFTLYALMLGGYEAEAVAWRDWLLRAAAGDPRQLQIMYGPAGERSLPEREIPWLDGYENSRPVRVGNGAADQDQLDVYGEVLDALHQGREVGLPHSDDAWDLQVALMECLEGRWREPDEGIWEVRSRSQHFTHSKVMAWVGADRMARAPRSAEDGERQRRWQALRAEIHAEVCEQAWNERMGAFTQAYGSDRLDASILLIPTVGFLPGTDERVHRTVDAVRDRLSDGSFVWRYEHGEDSGDGLPPGEGAFLACSFWLADALLLTGRAEDAAGVFQDVVAVANDVGLLAEEYDPTGRRLLGNFPQAFSHVGLANTVRNLSSSDSAIGRRQQ